MSTGTGATAQDNTWKAKEESEEARYIRQKEQAQYAALQEQMKNKAESNRASPQPKRDFEGGFGGQEDLEDRYATTSGEH